MWVYLNNLNYLHYTRGYFRLILGKNGITPMALCGLQTAVPIGISHDLRTNPQLFKKNWRRKNCWRKQLNQIRKNFQYLNCLVAFRRSKKTAARLQSELEFEQASLGLQAVFHSLTASFLSISLKANERKKLKDNWRKFWWKSQIYRGA